MIGRIHTKRAVKFVTGRLAVFQHTVSSMRLQQRACILTYHRIADINFIDSHLDDWNVHPKIFERQIKAATEFGTVIPLMDLPSKLKSNESPDRPWVCLTFDDGFANFLLNAVPILKKYNAHATLFVPTSQIGGTNPMPFDRWGNRHQYTMDDVAWRPLTWDELTLCLDSKVVSIGSHSHQHLNAIDCSAEQLSGEAARSRDILVSKLGRQVASMYAYPYGCTRLGQAGDSYVAAVKQEGYELAVSTNLGLASKFSDSYLFPRIEAHSLDSPAVIRAKLAGSLAGYFLSDRFRKSRRG